MSPQSHRARSESSAALARWLWRDPDPVWRWASGQYVRQWWKRPIVSVALTGAALAALVVGLGMLLEGRDPAVVRAVACGAIVAVLYPLLFWHVAGHPFAAFGRLGGPLMLRQLTVSSLGTEELGRILFWGSYRWLGLPSVALLWAFEAAGAGLFLAAFGLHGLTARIEELGFLGASGAFFWVFVKPPLDHMMNLAISWWLYFRTGRKSVGQLLSLSLVVVGFPAFFLLVNVFWIMLDLESAMSLSWAFGVLAVKAAFARRCYRRFVSQWDRCLGERFGEGA
jgi:hypothetical protein